MVVEANVLRRLVNIVDGAQASALSAGMQCRHLKTQSIAVLAAVHMPVVDTHHFAVPDMTSARCLRERMSFSVMGMKALMCVASLCAQSADGVKAFWAELLSQALQDLAAAADPLSPWLAQQAATNASLLTSHLRGGPTLEQVKLHVYGVHL